MCVDLFLQRASRDACEANQCPESIRLSYIHTYEHASVSSTITTRKLEISIVEQMCG